MYHCRTLCLCVRTCIGDWPRCTFKHLLLANVLYVVCAMDYSKWSILYRICLWAVCRQRACKQCCCYNTHTDTHTFTLLRSLSSVYWLVCCGCWCFLYLNEQTVHLISSVRYRQKVMVINTNHVLFSIYIHNQSNAPRDREREGKSTTIRKRGTLENKKLSRMKSKVFALNHWKFAFV